LIARQPVTHMSLQLAHHNLDPIHSRRSNQSPALYYYYYFFREAISPWIWWSLAQ